MKGLLLKDFYIAVRQCRIHLAVIVITAIVSALGGAGSGYLLFPMLFAGMVPVLVLSVEERCGWHRFAGTLPVSRRVQVTEKYLSALIMTAATALFMGVVWGVRAAVTGESLLPVLRFALPLMSFGMLFPAFTLPPMLRFGVEKGRVVTMVLAALAAALIAGAGFLTPDGSPQELGEQMGMRLFIIAVALLFLSWSIAVRLYEKREL